ncbi:hypothetical protein D3C71_1777140 [compost metagenome]
MDSPPVRDREPALMAAATIGLGMDTLPPDAIPPTSSTCAPATMIGAKTPTANTLESDFAKDMRDP